MLCGIYDEVEAFEHDLAEKRLAPGRTDETVGVHRSAECCEDQRARDRHLDLLIVCERDYSLVYRSETEDLDHVLGKEYEDSPRVDEHVGFDAPDLAGLERTTTHETPVVSVLQHDRRTNLTHLEPPG